MTRNRPLDPAWLRGLTMPRISRRDALRGFLKLDATKWQYIHGVRNAESISPDGWTHDQYLLDREGNDEVFRAHEVAHQWWGIGVDFATYHDQWLSEGLSNFSGLWYLHAARRDSDRYFATLRRWRSEIFARRDEPSPIWLGYRASSSKDELGYQVLIYQKGAWVLHMLRVLMLELRTAKDDRFTAMMREFYHTYRGRRASTEDFRHVVEQHIGMDMDDPAPDFASMARSMGSRTIPASRSTQP